LARPHRLGLVRLHKAACSPTYRAEHRVDLFDDGADIRRHDRIAEDDLRRLFIAATRLYNGLGKVILDGEYRPL
jgi:hypothetical protein